jgi:hypothetical protein
MDAVAVTGHGTFFMGKSNANKKISTERSRP